MKNLILPLVFAFLFSPFAQAIDLSPIQPPPPVKQPAESYVRYLQSDAANLGDVFDNEGLAQTLLTWTEDIPLCYVQGHQDDACNYLTSLLQTLPAYSAYCVAQEETPTLYTTFGINYRSYEFEYHKDIDPCPTGVK